VVASLQSNTYVIYIKIGALAVDCMTDDDVSGVDFTFHAGAGFVKFRTPCNRKLLRNQSAFIACDHAKVGNHTGSPDLRDITASASTDGFPQDDIEWKDE
jgi:hypothetical protein